ncbi:aminoacyl-tRNA hydrolase [soil metagenome]
MYIVVGLGNPGEEYRDTRHNTGRLAVAFLDKKEIKNVKLVHLETFMNKSGSGVAKVVKSKLGARKLVVIYDDLDLPLGKLKVSYDRGSGGHKGIESIIKALGTREFIRLRVGISPTAPSGKLKKPSGDKDVEKHIMGEFSKKEKEILNDVFKKVAEAVELISTETLQTAMTHINSGK